MEDKILSMYAKGMTTSDIESHMKELYDMDISDRTKRKLKRGFKTRKEALEWEQHFRMGEESNLDMTFGVVQREMIYV